MTYLVGLATVAAALGGFAVAGNAFGSEWTTYDGRVSAGQAYLIDVPEGAEGLQIEFVPGLLGGGEAKATLFSPADERVGHYALDADEPTVLLEEPDAGGYVLYVFDVRGGVLTASVKADDADALELVTLETATENIEIASQAEAGAFRAVDTVTLDREPVFESLLYQGSATNLSGSVRSLTGETSVVRAESGTAHGPGLFTSQSGERASFPENFAAGIHTVDVLADTFEGTLFLTVVHYVRADVVDVPDEVEAPQMPVNAVELEEFEATALSVSGGVLNLGLLYEEEKEEDEDDEDDGGEYAPPAGGRWYDHEYRAVAAVFTPDDELLAFVELNEEAPIQSLSLDEDGEYVVFLYGVSYDAKVFAALGDGAAFDAARHLRVSENKVPLDEVDLPIAYEETFTLDVAKAPLMAGIAMDGDLAMAVDLRAVIHTEAGELETYTWQFPNTPITHWGHMGFMGEELVSGAWTIDVEAMTASGDLVLCLLEYDREHEDEDENHDH